MNLTNKILLLSLISLIISCTASKGKVNFKKPESVALAFMQKLAEMDVEGAKELGTEDTKQVLGFLEMAMNMADEEEKEKMKAESAENSKFLKKATCEVNGDEAKCKLCCDEEGNGFEDEDMILKKVEGKWLVHMSKEDMMGEGF
jgi:hypothetical protein